MNRPEKKISIEKVINGEIMDKSKPNELFEYGYTMACIGFEEYLPTEKEIARIILAVQKDIAEIEKETGLKVLDFENRLAKAIHARISQWKNILNTANTQEYK